MKFSTISTVLVKLKVRELLSLKDMDFTSKMFLAYVFKDVRFGLKPDEETIN